MLDITDAILSITAQPDQQQHSFRWERNSLSGSLPPNLSLSAALLPGGPPESAPCDEGQWRLSISLNPRGRYELEVWWDNVSSRPYDLLFELALVWEREDEDEDRGPAEVAHAVRVLCGPSRVESTFGWAKFDLFPETILARQAKFGQPALRLRVACPSLAV